MRKAFILYDDRAYTGDTDDATVLDTADSEAEARESNQFHSQGVWYEYDRDDQDNLSNGNIREDLSPRYSHRKLRRRK